MQSRCTVICPLYKAEEYIRPLAESLLKQENVKIAEINFVLTDTGGSEIEILKELAAANKVIHYEVIKPSEFSHSLTREKAAFNAKGDVIVFVTQDVEIRDPEFLAKLIRPIVAGEAEAAYARQKTKYNNIEKYTRESNYPSRSFVVTEKDIEKRGLKTFFFSDAAGAISREWFVKLGGYDGKKLPISEDMYFAYKLIMAGGRIKYCADAVVYHSHKFSVHEIYDRYKLTGKFFRENSYLDQYGTTGSGAGLAKHVLRRILQEGRVDLLCRYPFDMGARWFGMKVGKR